jgi:hypothetical protein
MIAVLTKLKVKRAKFKTSIKNAKHGETKESKWFVIFTKEYS